MTFLSPGLKYEETTVRTRSSNEGKNSNTGSLIAICENIAPVIVGEFGGRSVGDDQEGIWQRALVSYLRENNISYIYWTLNPNSGDTGGILLDDWQTVDPNKRDLLSGYQFPHYPVETVTLIPVTPTTTMPARRAASCWPPSSSAPAPSK